MIRPELIRWVRAVLTDEGLPEAVAGLPETLEVPLDVLLWLVMGTYSRWPVCPDLLRGRASAAAEGVGMVRLLPGGEPAAQDRVLRELEPLLPEGDLDARAELAVALQDPQSWERVEALAAGREGLLDAAGWCLRGGQAERALRLLDRWLRRLPRRPRERRWALEEGVRSVARLNLFRPDPEVVRAALEPWVPRLWRAIENLPDEVPLTPVPLLAEAFRWELPCAEPLLDALPDEVPVADPAAKLLALLLAERWTCDAWRIGEFLDAHRAAWEGLSPRDAVGLLYHFPSEIPDNGAERPAWMGWGLWTALAGRDRLPGAEETEVLLEHFDPERLDAARAETCRWEEEARATLARAGAPALEVGALLESARWALEPLARLERWLQGRHFPWLDWVRAHGDAALRGRPDPGLTEAFLRAFAGLQVTPMPDRQRLEIAQAEGRLRAIAGRDPWPALECALEQLPLLDEIDGLGAFASLALLGARPELAPWRETLFARLADLVAGFSTEWHSDLWAALTHTRVRAREIPQALALLARQPSAEARLGVLSRFSSVLTEIGDTTLYPEVLAALEALIPEVPEHADAIRWRLAFARILKGEPAEALAALSL